MGSEVRSHFFSARVERREMQFKSPKRLYTVVVEFHNGMTRNVKVKAVSRDKAESRALKFHPTAKRIKRDVV